jgi:hypothetical protein
MAHLPCRYKFGHCADGLLHGHVRVGAVLVVQVDMVDTQTGQ